MRNSLAIAREARESSETWSLCWQAAVGRSFFVHPSLIELIRTRLIGAHHRQGRVLVDYLLLPTEIHAISQLRPEDSVAGVARSFGNVVARWVRDVQPLHNPVLAGPYHAQRLDGDNAVREEIKMLAWRPVFKRESSRRNHYPHAGLRHALGLTPWNGFDSWPLLLYFGVNAPEARAALRACLVKPPTEETWRAWELSRGIQLATGSVGPSPSMARKVSGPAAVLIAAAGGYGIDSALELLEVWVTTRLSPSVPVDLHAGSDAVAARGRGLVGGLAVTHHLCSAASVARHFGRAKATLSEQMAACRLRPADRLILRTPLQRIAQEASALRRS
jgi:hypothetical protein